MKLKIFLAIILSGLILLSQVSAVDRFFLSSSDELIAGSGVTLTQGAGTVTITSTGGAGDVSTDVIWDAAGDLVQGTGANTGAKLSAGAAGKVLRAAGTGTAVDWSDYTIATPTTGGLLYGSGTGAWANLVAGTVGKILQMGASIAGWSTPTFPTASPGALTVLRGDGTNWITSGYTIALPTTSGHVLTSNGTNWTSATPGFPALDDVTDPDAAKTFTLLDNNASALSFGSTGKADILKIITTDGAEGVSINGTLTVVQTAVGGFSKLLEGTGGGTNFRTVSVPDALTADVDLRHADALPAINQFQLYPAPTTGVSQYVWTTYQAYLGTTLVDFTRASAALTLAGITLTTPDIGAATGTSVVLTGNGTFQGGSIIIGKNTTTIGTVKLFGNTSGDATITPPAVAGTSTVLTLPGTTGTLALNNQTMYIGSTAVVINRATNPLTLAGITLTAPVLGDATATSLLASGIVDGAAPITITATSAGTAIGGTYKSGYILTNPTSASATSILTLPTAVAGLQYCVGNGAEKTGILRVLTALAPTGTQYIDLDGVLTANTGGIQFTAVAGNFGCFIGVDATHWKAIPTKGTATKVTR